MLSRLSEGLRSRRLDQGSSVSYSQFLGRTEDLLARQVFPDACVSRRHAALECAQVVLDVSVSLVGGPSPSSTFATRRFASSLAFLLDDGYARARDLALSLLLRLRSQHSSSQMVAEVAGELFSWETVLSDCAASSPLLTTGAPYKASLLLWTGLGDGCLGFAEGSTRVEVLEGALERLLGLVRTALSESSQIDRDSPTYGLLLCMRKLFGDLLEQKDEGSVKRLAPWAAGVLDSMHEVRSKTAYVLESDSPEGFSRGVGHDAVEVQADLLCAWRASKETSLLLADVFLAEGMLTVHQQEEVLAFFCRMLEATVHRGAFEQAFAGFVRICSALWNSPERRSQDLVRSLLKSTISNVRSKEFCSTRRSAGGNLSCHFFYFDSLHYYILLLGIPFLVQALIASQPPTTDSMPHVAATMETLLETAASAEVSIRVQSCNILRGLYRNNNLGENVGGFVEEGMRLCFAGFHSANWSVSTLRVLPTGGFCAGKCGGY